MEPPAVFPAQLTSLELGCLQEMAVLPHQARLFDARCPCGIPRSLRQTSSSLTTLPPPSWQVTHLQQLRHLGLSNVGWANPGWQALALLAGSLRRLDLNYSSS